MKFLKTASIQKFLMKISKREKSILYFAAIIMSLTLLDRLVIFPIRAKMVDLSGQIADRTVEIRQSKHIIKHKDRILKEAIKYKTLIKSSKTEEEEMTTLLKEVENLASKNSIYLVNMKPGGLEESPTSKKYILNLNCEAQLEQMVQFMYEIEKSKKLLSINKYKINPKSKDSSVARCRMSISKIVIP